MYIYMASSPTAPLLLFLLAFLIIPSVAPLPEAQDGFPYPVADGLSWTYYSFSCPPVEFIVRDYLIRAFRKDIGLAAGLLRLHFHDCFVQGCDGSVLLDGSASGPSEKDAPPNLTLRAAAFAAINELRDLLEWKCGRRVVSCADIAALAARDAVFLSGGPAYPVPLGRRDGLTFATTEETVASLPPPFFNTTALLAALAALGLDAVDLVALSGGHTIGLAHCTSFTFRLYPSQDPTMDDAFAQSLYATCPTTDSNNTRVMDGRTPSLFDNGYYIGLVSRRGMFTSDQDLFTDPRTRGIVARFATDQLLFFQRFALAMVKMGQLGVLTGSQGEVRANCSARNPAGGEWEALRTVVGGAGGSAVF